MSGRGKGGKGLGKFVAFNAFKQLVSVPPCIGSMRVEESISAWVQDRQKQERKMSLFETSGYNEASTSDTRMLALANSNL